MSNLERIPEHYPVLMYRRSDFKIWRATTPVAEWITRAYGGDDEVYDVYAIATGDIAGSDTILCYVARVRNRLKRFWIR